MPSDSITFQKLNHSSGAGFNDPGNAADGARAGTKSLDGLNVLIAIGNLAEDNVLAVEPAGDNSSDEELGAIAFGEYISPVIRPGERGKSEETHVLAPALAMERRPGLVCFTWKFSSANFSP